jgi:hypothetical protein
MFHEKPKGSKLPATGAGDRRRIGNKECSPPDSPGVGNGFLLVQRTRSRLVVVLESHAAA